MNIAILITNPNHHLELTLPVATRLVDQGVSVKYISLCELRRMKTPGDLFDSHKIPYTQMKALAGDMKPSTGSQSLGDSNSLKRRLLRRAFWLLKLRKFVVQSLKGVDQVILLNDAAFPGDMICELLTSRKIPFYLMQEGIRFPLPVETESQYGGNGAAKVLSWGEHSAEHFNSVKKVHTQVVSVGSPRIDKQYDFFLNSHKADQQSVLGLFTNPVDDMGYTSFDEKIELVKTFVEKFSSIINSEGIHVLIKSHPREDPSKYLEVVEPHIEQCSISTDGINDAINKVDVGVIMASTVGLELMMAAKPVIQLKLPRYGYVFDYTSAGSAIPVDELDERRFKACFAPDNERNSAYLSSHFANLGQSAEAIVKELMA